MRMEYVKVKFGAFFASTRKRSEWSASHSDRFTPG